MNKIQPYQQTEKENNNDYNWHGELIKRGKIMFSNHSFTYFEKEKTLLKLLSEHGKRLKSGRNDRYFKTEVWLEMW